MEYIRDKFGWRIVGLPKPLQVKSFGMRWFVQRYDKNDRLFKEYCCPQFRTKKEALKYIENWVKEN